MRSLSVPAGGAAFPSVVGGSLDFFVVAVFLGDVGEVEFAHFVVGFPAPGGALGGRERIEGVLGGVVVCEVDVDSGAFREIEGFLVDVDVLPAEVPARDVDEGDGLAVGLGGDRFNIGG